MSKKNYGFGLVHYDNMDPIPCVTLGDGTTAIMSVEKDCQNFVAVGFLTADGKGIGIEETLPEGTRLPDIGPELVLRFDNEASIDVLINQLNKAKEYLLL